MANRNVIVRAPNGRRQTVKVTANSTMLQVLEEVCQKHGYNVDDYDLKHFNEVLDPNAILRFTGLPNNAQLEMIPCTKTRLNSTVTIGIQLENGERLIADCMPNETLAEVLQRVGLDQDLEKVALTYMHREIYGVDTLKKTTLKSLGLNSGKAVIRLIHKNPQNLNVDVSPPSTSSKRTENVSVDNKTISSNKTNIETKAEIIETKTETIETKTETIKNTNEKRDVPEAEENKSSNSVKKNTYVEFLGERNALVYNQAAMQPVSRDEFPDDFYDLTVNDAKVILRDVKRYRKELEEAPLLTNVQRQLDQEKRILDQLNKYHYTIIRIHFPDQFTLQGLFKPTETVQMIKDFVKSYLTDPNSDFVIFTTPPKRILDPLGSLINENLVPCANVYYSGPSTLKSDVKEKVTDPMKVKRQVAEIRTSMSDQGDQTSGNDTKTDSTTHG